MSDLIILALSNALTMLLTAWFIHRAKIGASPLPALKLKPKSDQDEPEPVERKKGRPVL